MDTVGEITGTRAQDWADVSLGEDDHVLDGIVIVCVGRAFLHLVDQILVANGN